MKITIEEFNRSVIQWATEKIIPNIKNPMIVFGIGFRQNAMLGTADAFLKSNGLVDERGNVDVDGLAVNIRQGFAVAKSIPLDQIGLPMELESSDAEEFITRYLGLGAEK